MRRSQSLKVRKRCDINALHIVPRICLLGIYTHIKQWQHVNDNQILLHLLRN
jgi:hypothetical protein